MSGMQLEYRVSVLVNDEQHWPSPWREAAAEVHEMSQVWAGDQLREVVRAAADAYLALHPGVFEFIDVT